MSYLSSLRLVFSGDFQADTSTINNDVRHFDNASFEDRFQEYPNGHEMNGWFNPHGSGAFRLLNCTVKAVHHGDGSASTSPDEDPVLGLRIGGSNDRVGAKLVDLDPQWQMSSQIWGLCVSLLSDTDAFLQGSFEPAAFRDLLFGRLETGSGDESASAYFQSTLTGVVFGEAYIRSKFLRELKAVSRDDELSIRLTTFGISSDHTSERFTIGTVLGVIGPCSPDEPRSFVLGRRMVPLNAQRAAKDINFFDCKLDGSRLIADLGNALPLLEADGSVKDIGTLRFGVLKNPGLTEGDHVGEDSFIPIGGEVPYRRENWLTETAGIFDTLIPETVVNTVQSNPLALVCANDGDHEEILIRESEGGLHVRADNFVHRLEPGADMSVDIYAARYGDPLGDAAIEIVLADPLSDVGGGGKGEVNPPKASVPQIGTPPDAIAEFDREVTTDHNGKAVVQIATTNPGKPRDYLDGQIYMLDYDLKGRPNNQKQQLDCVVLLLFSNFDVPDEPDWEEHIEPIMKLYSNLYPIMSHQLFDLGDYRAVVRHRALLELAFSLDTGDPNYMPVTRDLSRPKRNMILNWLRETDDDGNYILRYGKGDAPAPKSVRRSVRDKRRDHVEKEGGKTRFHRLLKEAQKYNPGD